MLVSKIMQLDTPSLLSLPLEMRGHIYSFTGGNLCNVRLLSCSEKELVDGHPLLKLRIFRQTIYRTLMRQKEFLKKENQWPLLKKVIRIEACRQFDSAWKFVNGMEEGDKKNELIVQLAAVRIHQDRKSALTLADTLNRYYKDVAMSAMAKEMSEKDALFAKLLTGKIQSHRLRLSTCIRIAELVGVDKGNTRDMLNTIEEDWLKENKEQKNTLAFSLYHDRLVSAKLMNKAVEKAGDNPDRSIIIAKKIPTISLTYPAQQLVAEKIAKKDPDKAKTIASGIRHDEYRDRAYLAIFKEELKGNRASAGRTIDQIQNPSIKCEAYGALLYQQSKDNLDNAVRLTGSIPTTTMKIEALIAYYLSLDGSCRAS